MFSKKLIIHSFLIAFIGKFCTSEWIEIPEFSDGSKIYRLSDKHRDKFNEDYLTRNYQMSNSTNYFKITPLMTTEKVFINNDFESTISVARNQTHFDHDDDDDEAVISEDDEMITENPKVNESLEDGEPEGGDDDESFVEYLPVELFKEVHKTLLKNRPTSADGKTEFLKSFELNLLGEIESRLVPLVNPVRRKRGSEHGEEDHMGFPSVEGALLAISFLTFACYLVQMVMLLFKHLSNNQPTSTVLVNRTKRSITMEETERILRYLNEFSLKYKKSPLNDKM